MRERGSSNLEHPRALPCCSVDEQQHGVDLIVLNCRLQWDGRYVLNEFSGEVDDVFIVGEMLERQYLLRR